MRPPRASSFNLTLTSCRLFHGNFVLDSAIPTNFLNLCACKDDREFTHIRYSAATRDSNDFKDNGFTLRTVHYDLPRRSELFIIMAMYNEDDALFALTMHGVMKNIAYLYKRDRSKTLGKEGCKRVVVCIVSDGGGNRNQRSQWQTGRGAYIRVYHQSTWDNHDDDLLRLILRENSLDHGIEQD